MIKIHTFCWSVQNTKYKIYPNSSTFVDQWSHLPFNWLNCNWIWIKLVRALSWGGMGPRYIYPFDSMSDEWWLKSTLFVDQNRKYKIQNTKYTLIPVLLLISDQWSHLPFNWFSCIYNAIKLVRAPSWGGMGPTYPFD